MYMYMYMYTCTYEAAKSIARDMRHWEICAIYGTIMYMYIQI